MFSALQSVIVIMVIMLTVQRIWHRPICLYSVFDCCCLIALLLSTSTQHFTQVALFRYFLFSLFYTAFNSTLNCFQVAYFYHVTMLVQYMPSLCVCLFVCLCVYLFVTLRYCIKMAKRSIMQIMLHDSPGIARVIGRFPSKVANFNPPTCICRPIGGDPVRISPWLRHQKTRVPGLSCGIIFVILCLAVLIQYSMTDRHMTTVYTALSITSCGKNIFL